MNKEVSRRHLEVYVNEDGNVCVLSMGREPICLNGEQVLSPRVLQTGDKIEVLLEGRTREFYFKAAKVDSVDAEREKVVEHQGIGSPLAASSIANQQAPDMVAEMTALPKVEEGGHGQGDMDHEDVAQDDVMEGLVTHQQVPEVVEEMDVPPAVEDGGPVQEENVVEDHVMAEEGAHDVECPPGAVAEMVSQMVTEIITRIVASAETAASILTPVSKSNKRKSVRFVATTPEGEARDATMTIRCTPKMDGDAVMVEDNTVAFSEWGFKTMGKDDAVEKKELQTSEGRGTPISAEMEVDFHSGPSQTTPCLAAPATTPVTMTKSGTAQKRNRAVDFNVLTRKLGEIAEEHDVQFELPKDFMRFTPLSTCKSKKKVSMGESCPSGASKRLSICSTSRDDMEYDLPKDFMRFTPMSVAVRSVQKETRSGASEESGKEFELSKSVMKFTPMSATGAHKQSSSTNGAVEYDLPKDFMRFTPMSVPSKRIDAGKIKSALKTIGQPLSAVGTIHESEDDGAEEIATLRSVGHAVHDLADALDHVASAKKSARRSKTPGVKITIVEKGDTFKTSNPEVKVLFDGMCGLDSGVDDGQPATAHERAPTTSNKSELLSRFKSALVQANSYRTQSLVLGKHLRKSSAKLSKFKATAHILSARYKAERAKRIELQNTLKKLIEVREKEVDETMIDDDEEEEIQHPHVVVVGYEEKDGPNNLELAGQVVVVRKPTDVTHGTSTTPQQPTTMRKERRVSVVRSAVKSIRRISVGTETHLVMDDVKMPTWIYDQDEEEDDDNKADMDDCREEYDPEEEKALDTLKKSLKSPLPDGPTEEEEELVAEDICHICKVGDDGDILLLCDSCDNACHLQCCKPPLKRVPKGDWFCVDCKQKAKPATKKAPAKRKAQAKKSPAAKKQAKENAPAPGSKVRPTRAAAKSKTTATRRTRAKNA